MYGLVNKAIEQLVCTQFGVETWELIKQEAGIDCAAFLSMDAYPDELTYRLVEAASIVLGLPSGEVLRHFGRYWTMYTANEGYGPLLHMTGGSLREFLLNLDNMHARVGLSFSDLQPPSFQCTDCTEQSLRLHYYSKRPGLAPMVVGLLEGLAVMFQVAISITAIAHRDMGDDHEIFLITFSE